MLQLTHDTRHTRTRHTHTTHTRHTHTHAHVQNYDIDVPLFLPIYAHGRLSDLRAIAATKTLGQMNFNSGWEWCVPNQTIQGFFSSEAPAIAVKF